MQKARKDFIHISNPDRCIFVAGRRGRQWGDQGGLNSPSHHGSLASLQGCRVRRVTAGGRRGGDADGRTGAAPLALGKAAHQDGTCAVPGCFVPAQIRTRIHWLCSRAQRRVQRLLHGRDALCPQQGTRGAVCPLLPHSSWKEQRASRDFRKKHRGHHCRVYRVAQHHSVLRPPPPPLHPVH